MRDKGIRREVNRENRRVMAESVDGIGRNA